MEGGFTCPHCDNFNRCACKICKEAYLKKGYSDNFVKWNGEFCICAKCNEKFHEAESLDIEWEKMLNDISKILTEEVCYEWIFTIIKSEENFKEYRPKLNELYKKYNYNEEWFNRMYNFHNEIPAYLIRKEGISGLRNLQIKKITKIK
jgi:hypothetical protein